MQKIWRRRKLRSTAGEVLSSGLWFFVCGMVFRNTLVDAASQEVFLLGKTKQNLGHGGALTQPGSMFFLGMDDELDCGAFSTSVYRHK